MAKESRLALEYVLPLRWYDDAELADLTAYLIRLARWVDVTVVDGSPAAIFDGHAVAWSGIVRHLPPDPRPGRNGKVAGVVTGVLRARHEHVVIADDDVRYRREALVEVDALLSEADLVRPQNVFDDLPWHAREDTARSLLNRALGADYPGTFGVRRSCFVAMGGYDGDVLFENLELVRTIRAAGGRELRAPWLFVARRPPTTQHFLRQRVRQAYDDFAQPVRLTAECAVLPTVLVLGWRVARGQASVRRRSLAGLVGGAAGTVLLAEVGRRKHGGRVAFAATAPLWAPLWVLERAVCIWVAVWLRLTGGVRYAGTRIPTAAHSIRFLRRRLRAREGVGSKPV